MWLPKSCRHWHTVEVVGRKWLVVTSVWPRCGVVARHDGSKPNLTTPTSYFISNYVTFFGSSKTPHYHLLWWLIVAGPSFRLIMFQNICISTCMVFHFNRPSLSLLLHVDLVMLLQIDGMPFVVKGKILSRRAYSILTYQLLWPWHTCRTILWQLSVAWQGHRGDQKRKKLSKSTHT